MAGKTAKGKSEPSRGDVIVRPSQAVSLTPAPVVESEAQTSNVPIPQEYAGGEEIKTLFPMVQFNEFTKPGQYVQGIYRGFKDNVGENESRVYMLADPTGNIVGVWGSTILDTKMDIAFTLPQGGHRTGDKVLIQFIGTVETKRKQNPAKDFRVVLLKQ